MKFVHLKLYAVLLCTALLTQSVLGFSILGFLKAAVLKLKKKAIIGAPIAIPAFIGAKLGTTAALAVPVGLSLGLSSNPLKGIGLNALGSSPLKPLFAGPLLLKAAIDGKAAGKAFGAGYLTGKLSGIPSVAAKSVPVSTIINGLPATTPVGALSATIPVGALPAINPVGAFSATTPVGALPVTTPVRALPIVAPVGNLPATTPVGAFSAEANGGTLPEAVNVEKWPASISAETFYENSVAPNLLPTQNEDWTLGDTTKFGYTFKSAFDNKNDYGFFKTQGPQGYSTGFEITDPVGGYAYSRSSIAASRRRRSLQTTIPEESDLQKTDFLTSEDTLVPELVKTFTFIQESDDNECVRKLVCEMAVDEKKYGQYGVEVTKFMLSLSSNDKDAPWYPYKAAAKLGKKYETLEACFHQFPQCVEEFLPVI